MSGAAMFEEASTRGLLERLGLGRSILSLAGSFLVAALLASACGRQASGGPKDTSPTPAIPPAAVLPNATPTAEPEPVLLATSTVEPAPAAAATAPPPINPTAPPRPTLAPAAPQPATGSLPDLLSFNRRADDLDVIMTISPARAGPNEVNFFFYDTNGDDRSIERLSARFSFLDFAVAPVTVDMVELHPGHAFLIDHQVRHAGHWRVELVIRRQGLRDATATFELAIR